MLLSENADAERLFDEVEDILSGCAEDHLIDLGNLCLFRFRIARRRGQYDEAEKRLKQGLAFYQQCTPPHRNIARVYTHLALIYRLKARALEGEKKTPKIDEEILQYREQALACLQNAEEIYQGDPVRNHQGLGKVWSTRAGVFFDSWDLKNAEEEVGRAFRLAQEKNDNLVMARARIIQCRIALRENKLTLRTLELAENAVRYAAATEYPRLQARAWVMQGMALLRCCDEVFGAEKCRDEAAHLLGQDDQDYLRDELDELTEEVEAMRSPDNIVIKRTLSDLINFRLSVKEDSGAKPKNGDPEARCDFQQIIEEIEEEILRCLLGLVHGRVQKVCNIWRVGAAKVRRARRHFLVIRL